MADFVQKLFDFLKQFWPVFIVLPWEGGVRARFGSRVSVLRPGVHFRLPFFDNVQTCNAKLRLVHTEPQTITTLDGRALVVAVTIGFRIIDPLAAVMRHHLPEWAVRSIAQGIVAEVVATTASASLSPALLQDRTLAALRTNSAGYEFEMCAVSEFGFVRTIRLLNSNGSPYSPAIDERRV